MRSYRRALEYKLSIILLFHPPNELPVSRRERWHCLSKLDDLVREAVDCTGVLGHPPLHLYRNYGLRDHFARSLDVFCQAIHIQYIMCLLADAMRFTETPHFLKSGAAVGADGTLVGSNHA